MILCAMCIIFGGTFLMNKRHVREKIILLENFYTLSGIYVLFVT